MIEQKSQGIADASGTKTAPQQASKAKKKGKTPKSKKKNKPMPKEKQKSFFASLFGLKDSSIEKESCTTESESSTEVKPKAPKKATVPAQHDKNDSSSAQSQTPNYHTRGKLPVFTRREGSEEAPGNCKSCGSFNVSPRCRLSCCNYPQAGYCSNQPRHHGGGYQGPFYQRPPVFF